MLDTATILDYVPAEAQPGVVPDSMKRRRVLANISNKVTEYGQPGCGHSKDPLGCVTTSGYFPKASLAQRPLRRTF